MPTRGSSTVRGNVGVVAGYNDDILPSGGNYLVVANFDNNVHNNIELALMGVIPGSTHPKYFRTYIGGLDTDWIAVSTNIVHSYWKLS